METKDTTLVEKLVKARNEGKQEGIKEVLDFLHDNSAGVMMNEYAFAVKLKEWEFSPEVKE